MIFDKGDLDAPMEKELRRLREWKERDSVLGWQIYIEHGGKTRTVLAQWGDVS